MLIRNSFYTYKKIPVPSFFVIEGFGYSRFKTWEELRNDFSYFLKKLLAILKKDSITGFSSLAFKTSSSFDDEISLKGGIVDCNGGIHTTSQSYKNFLKENGLVIRDWSEGSLKKPTMHTVSKVDVAEIVNKYL